MSEVLIAVLGGGGLTALVTTIFAITQKANNKAVTTLEKVWKEEKRESANDRAEFKRIIMDTNIKVGDLRNQIEDLKVEVAKLEPWTCYKVGCENRIVKHESRSKKNSEKA